MICFFKSIKDLIYGFDIIMLQKDELYNLGSYCPYLGSQAVESVAAPLRSIRSSSILWSRRRTDLSCHLDGVGNDKGQCLERFISSFWQQRKRTERESIVRMTGADPIPELAYGNLNAIEDAFMTSLWGIVIQFDLVYIRPDTG